MVRTSAGGKMKVPSAIRRVFDTFPLIAYENKESIEKQALYESSYPFTCRGSPGPCEKSLNLAVHNVRRILLHGQVTKIIPTDPHSLASALLLCKQYDMLLPDEETSNPSTHAIIPMSYLASPDKELPMLLETKNYDNDGNDEVNEILPISSLNLNSSQKPSCLESMFSDFLDSLNDLWILIFLDDNLRKDPLQIEAMFHRDFELKEYTIIRRQIDSKLLTELKSWNCFATRYPNIFPHSAIASNSVLNYVFSALNPQKALEKAYNDKLDEFVNFVPLFMAYLNTDAESDSRDTLEIKFVSFMICVEHLLPEYSQISTVCKDKFNDVLNYSNRFLMQF